MCSCRQSSACCFRDSSSPSPPAGARRCCAGPPPSRRSPGREQLVGEVSQAAEAFGIHPGMRLGEALARCPRLALVPPDPGRGRRRAGSASLGALEAIGARGRGRPSRARVLRRARPAAPARRHARRRASRRCAARCARPARIGAGPTRFCALAAAARARARRAAIVARRGRAGRRARRAAALPRRDRGAARGARAPRRPHARRRSPRCRARRWPTASARPGCSPTTSPAAATRRCARAARESVLEEALELPESASGEQLERALELLVDRLLARRERDGRTLRAVVLGATLVEGGTWRERVVFREPLADPARMRLVLAQRLAQLPAPAEALRLAVERFGPPHAGGRALFDDGAAAAPRAPARGDPPGPRGGRAGGRAARARRRPGLARARAPRGAHAVRAVSPGTAPPRRPAAGRRRRAGRGGPPGVGRPPRGRRRARVVAHRGPLVDRPAAAPPLLGGGDDRRARPRRLPRARGRTLVPPSLIRRSLGAIARLCRDARRPRGFRHAQRTVARDRRVPRRRAARGRSCWAVEPPPSRARRAPTWRPRFRTRSCARCASSRAATATAIARRATSDSTARARSWAATIAVVRVGRDKRVTADAPLGRHVRRDAETRRRSASRRRRRAREGRPRGAPAARSRRRRHAGRRRDARRRPHVDRRVQGGSRAPGRGHRGATPRCPRRPIAARAGPVEVRGATARRARVANASAPASRRARARLRDGRPDRRPDLLPRAGRRGRPWTLGQGQQGRRRSASRGAAADALCARRSAGRALDRTGGDRHRRGSATSVKLRRRRRAVVGALDVPDRGRAPMGREAHLDLSDRANLAAARRRVVAGARESAAPRPGRGRDRRLARRMRRGARSSTCAPTRSTHARACEVANRGDGAGRRQATRRQRSAHDSSPRTTRGLDGQWRGRADCLKEAST